MVAEPFWYRALTDKPGRANRKPDGRFNHTYPEAHAVTRGRIHNLRGVNSPEQPHVFHFLTNPLEISTSYRVNMDVDLTDPANSTASMQAVPPMIDGLLSLSFNILLDRSYEVWDGSLPEGVLHDIAQLERVLGLPDIEAHFNAGWSGGMAAPVVAPGMVDRSGGMIPDAYHRFPGVIVKRPVRFLFGGLRAFSFDGYVSSLSISMMKFSRNMTPTRAGLQISAESWGTHDADPISSGGVGSGQSQTSRMFNGRVLQGNE